MLYSKPQWLKATVIYYHRHAGLGSADLHWAPSCVRSKQGLADLGWRICFRLQVRLGLGHMSVILFRQRAGPRLLFLWQRHGQASKNSKGRPPKASEGWADHWPSHSTGPGSSTIFHYGSPVQSFIIIHVFPDLSPLPYEIHAGGSRSMRFLSDQCPYLYPLPSPL